MRLIDADALIDRIKNPYEQAQVARWVNEQPTIEPEKRTQERTETHSCDLISRQAAIDAIQQHREDVLGGYEYDEGVAFVYAAAHNHIIDVIKHLPSAQPEPCKGEENEHND